MIFLANKKSSEFCVKTIMANEIAVLSSTIVLALLNRFFPAIQYTIIGIIILAACAYKPVRSFYLVEAVFSVYA